MGRRDEALASLREAVRHSPDNVPLRVHLGRELLARGLAGEAVDHYRAALRIQPEDAKLRVGLADAFWQAGKRSESLVLVEDLLRGNDVPATALLLHARILLRSDPERAARQYRRALDADPDVADPELAERLGVRARDEDAEREIVDGRIRARREEAEPDSEFDVERPTIDFSAVGGMDAVKELIRKKIVMPLQHPELYEAYGQTAGGGVLLYGPPGCGKTHIARATAGEVKAGFLCIGLHDVLDMWIGQSEQRLHEIFQEARRNAPSVLFFDEVDALGASRSDMRKSAGRHLINQFLSEMDGAQASNEGVLVLAATNAPWHLDNAFRRPGRFDRMVFVPPPDESGRAAILRVQLANKPVRNLDYEHVANQTRRYSGADLAAVVGRAVESKLDAALEAGKPQPLTTKDLLRAVKKTKPTTREWFATARNYILYANEGGIYDDVIGYLDSA